MKGTPIPTKLDLTDEQWLDLLCKRTGLKRSEVIRRAVRALSKESMTRPKWNWVEETANPMPPLDPQQELELGDKPPKDFDEANTRAKAKSQAERSHRRR